MPITQPFCQSLEDLSTTSPLELYKSQIAERICTNQARPEENLLIGKSYLKAFEEVGSNLLEGRPNIKVYSRFFELMEIILARDGLSVKSPTLESSIKKFITEVL